MSKFQILNMKSKVIEWDSKYTTMTQSRPKAYRKLAQLKTKQQTKTTKCALNSLKMSLVTVNSLKC